MREITTHSEREIAKNQAYSEKTGLAQQKLMDLVENIVPKPENSELETLVDERYQTVVNLFENTPVNTNNTITPLHL